MNYHTYTTPPGLHSLRLILLQPLRCKGVQKIKAGTNIRTECIHLALNNKKLFIKLISDRDARDS